MTIYVCKRGLSMARGMLWALAIEAAGVYIVYTLWHIV